MTVTAVPRSTHVSSTVGEVVEKSSLLSHRHLPKNECKTLSL